MRIRRFLIPLLIPTLATLSSVAQVGTWYSHTDMQDVRSLAVTASGIWAATGGGVFQQDAQTHSYRQYTNIDGLGATEFTALLAGDSVGIVAGAANGAINIRNTSGAWSLVPDIMRATDKPQRGITFLRWHAGRLYIGTEFGVSLFDVAHREFRETWVKFGTLPTLVKATDMLVSGGSIMVTTMKGVALAPLSTTNLQDPANWRTFDNTSGLPSAEVLSIASFAGTIVVGTSKGLATFDGAGFHSFAPTLDQQAVKRLLVWQGRLLAMTDAFLFTVDENGGVGQVGETLEPPTYMQGTMFRDMTIMSDGRLLVSTTRGITIHEQGRPWSLSAPPGPNANQFVSLSVDAEGILWSATGRDAAGLGAFGFTGTEWVNYRKETHPAFTTNDVIVTAAGADGSMWFGTWGFGVIHRSRSGELTRYDADNTPGFPGIPKNEKFSPISGIATDQAGNTWFLHYLTGNGKIISCRGADGKWRFYSCPFFPGELELGLLTIDQSGAKWMILPRQGLLMFNDNGTLDDVSDDTWKVIDQNSSSGLNAALFNDVVTDRLGDLWIGSDLGLRTVFSPQYNDKVTRTCYNTRCNIEGLAINCIAVDPVNNKWVGTKNGVFVLSSDGGTIMDQFTSTNSPLLDSDVRSIAIHPKTGVAYLGTNKGLSAVQTPYAAPVATMGDLVIWPNPFHPSTDSRVTIDGLGEGSSLKILTPSGDLVVELPTAGGRTGFWDGRDARGTLVASGMYFVVAFTSDGSQVARGKVAVIKD